MIRKLAMFSAALALATVAYSQQQEEPPEVVGGSVRSAQTIAVPALPSAGGAPPLGRQIAEVVASDLRSTPEPRVEQARLQAEADRLGERLSSVDGELGAAIHARLAEARAALEHALVLWRREAEERAQGLSLAWREARREARVRLREARRAWRDALRLLAQVPGTA